MPADRLCFADLAGAESGQFVILAWVDCGTRHAAGCVRHVSDKVVKVEVRPYRGPVRTLLLHEPVPRSIVDRRRGREYNAFQPNERELSSCERVFAAIPVEGDLEQEEAVEVELTPKEIAGRLLAVLTKEPMSAKAACIEADIEYAPVVVDVLKLLRESGKVKKKRIEKEDGNFITKWFV